MIKVYNDFIPFDGYMAMTFWPFLFIRNSCRKSFDDVDENHEEIHGRQQLEMLPVGLLIAAGMYLLGCGWWSLLGIPVYFWWYLTEYLVRTVAYQDAKEAYRNIAFEQEAYLNEPDFHFLSKRKCFGWVRYLFRKTYRRKSSGNTQFESDNF